MYDDNVKAMFTKGYADSVRESEISHNHGTVWYLSHYPVLNKKGEVQYVFDCAEWYKGVSLNIQYCQGPDLVNKPIRVFQRFQQFKYVTMTNIEAMYVQVRSLNYIRILWDSFGMKKMVQWHSTKCYIIFYVVSVVTAVLLIL